MILETMGSGPLGVAAREAIRGMEEGVRSTRGDDPDLFMKALGCHAIVSAAGSSLLDGRLEPAPSPERMRGIVRAANAPGVKLVVAVVPTGGRYDDEELVLKKDGIPYVILRCAPLIEELADAANFHVTSSLWLAPGQTIAVSSSSALAAAVARALRDDTLQGATVEVASTPIELSEALRRAARIAGASTTVRTAPRSVSAAVHAVARWLHVPQPPALALCERMLGSAA
jgi:hypothetical protein